MRDAYVFDLGAFIHRQIERSEPANHLLVQEQPFSYLQGDARANLTADLMQQLIDSLKVGCAASMPPGIWLIAPDTYNWLRWHQHVVKAYPLPVRKLRKCYLRKRMKRMQRARRRYAE